MSVARVGPSDGRWRAVGCVVPCVLCWALIPTLAGNIGKTGLSWPQYLFWSNLVSTLVLLGVACLKGRVQVLGRYTSTDVVHLSVLGGLGAFGYYALVYSAYNTNTKEPGVLVIVQYTWPVLTAVLSACALRQRMSRRTQIALLLAMTAIAVGFGLEPRRDVTLYSILTMAIAAVLFAVYSVWSSRRSYEPFTYMAAVFGAGTVLSLVWMLGTPAPRHAEPGNTALALALVLLNGVFVNGVSYVWWLEALRRAPASFVAPWASLTPLLAASVLALSNRDIDPAHWVGVGLILVSVLLSVRRVES